MKTSNFSPPFSSHKVFRGMVAFAQIVAAMSGAVVGAVRPQLPDSMEALQPWMGVPLVVAAESNQAAPLASLSGDLPTPPINVLTVSKTVVGSSDGPFTITITGPNGVVSETTIMNAQVLTFALPDRGVYTVTEIAPSGTIVTYTSSSSSAMTPVSSSASGVVSMTAPASPYAPFSVSAITGTVFNDLNSDGNMVITETGVAAVTVTAYDSTGAVVGSGTTDASGLCTITPSGNGPYRLEFSSLPTGYEPSRVVTTSTDNDSSVQFINIAADASGADFGILQPAAFVSFPLYAIAGSFVNGDPTAAGNTVGSIPVLHSFNVDYNGKTPVPSTVATAGQVGSIWGIAWQPSANKVYVSAYVKRHAGLGSLGLGGIYVISDPLGTPSESPFVDLEAVPFGLNLGDLPDNVTRGLPITPTGHNTDTVTFAAVGKQGLGDLDLTEDQSQLWAVDMYNRGLVKMNVAGGIAPSGVTTYSLDAMIGIPSCTQGVLRPFGLKFHNGLGYLGVVCTGENASQTTQAEETAALDYVKSYVLSFDPTAPGSATIEMTVPMTYAKGQASSNANTYNDNWYAWTDDWNYGLWRSGNPQVWRNSR